jgi:hypothetical protein
VDDFFKFFEKIGKIFSGTCRYYVRKRYKCDRKGGVAGEFLGGFIISTSGFGSICGPILGPFLVQVGMRKC